MQRREGLVARALALRPLRAMGVISYGVYLWHWPLYVVLTEERTGVSGARLLGVRLAATLLIAWLSYRFFERPIRARGIVWGRPVVVVPAAIALAVAIVLASTRGARAKTPPPVALTAPELPALPPAPAPTTDAASVAPMHVLVLGDSVAMSLGAWMHWTEGYASANVEQRAIGDCSILDGFVPVNALSGAPHENGNCAGSWVQDVTELHPDVTLIVLGGAFFSSVKADGRWRSVCESGWHDAYSKRLVALLQSMAPHAGRRVVLLPAYPVGKWRTPTLNDKVDCYNRILRETAEAAGAETIDLNGYLCPDRECVVMSNNAPVRADGLHFEGVGAVDTAHWVLATLRAGTDAGTRDP